MERLPPDKQKVKLENDLWLLQHPDFRQKPVTIRTFIDDPYYLNIPHDVWQSIKDELTEFYTEPFVYEEAVLDKAIGAGKSYWTGICTAYEVYKLGCLKDPLTYFKLAKGSKIAVMIMSPRANQAKDIIFGSVYEIINASQWFQDWMKPNPYVRSRLEFINKKIYVIPGNSNETFPTGYNVIVAIMDECAFYVSTDNRDVAENIYTSLKRRILSRFGSKGLIIMISSPRYIDDFIERKMSEAKTNPKIFARRKTLWQMKPGFDLSVANTFEVNLGTEVIRVPHLFKTDYDRNPEKFIRDFCAIPSLALEPYIKDYSAIAEMWTTDIKNLWSTGSKMLVLNQRPPDTPCFVHVDLGLVKDRAGIAIVTKTEDNHVNALLLMTMQGSKKHNLEVDFSEVRHIIMSVRSAGYNIQLVTYDGWQSADSKQQLEKAGFNVAILSVDKNLAPYDTMKQLMYERALHCPKVELLETELKRLELVKGKKVDHPKGCSKDLADALAGACYNAMTTVTYEPMFGNANKVYTRKGMVKQVDRVLI